MTSSGLFDCEDKSSSRHNLKYCFSFFKFCSKCVITTSADISGAETFRLLRPTASDTLLPVHTSRTVQDILYAEVTNCSLELAGFPPFLTSTCIVSDKQRLHKDKHVWWCTNAQIWSAYQRKDEHNWTCFDRVLRLLKQSKVARSLRGCRPVYYHNVNKGASCDQPWCYQEQIIIH